MGFGVEVWGLDGMRIGGVRRGLACLACLLDVSCFCCWFCWFCCFSFCCSFQFLTDVLTLAGKYKDGHEEMMG